MIKELMTSQYRCETCKNHIYEKITYCDFCIAKPLIKYRIVPKEMYLINMLGCASNSDFQYPIPNDEQCRICQQATRKDERERVLDELVAWIEKDREWADAPDGWCHSNLNLLRKFKELREGKDGE
jgi:hypothetical protein